MKGALGKVPEATKNRPRNSDISRAENGREQKRNSSFGSKKYGLKFGIVNYPELQKSVLFCKS